MIDVSEVEYPFDDSNEPEIKLRKHKTGNLSHTEQKSKDYLIINLVKNNNQTFSVVKSPEFIAFCNRMDLCYNVPVRHTVAERIKVKFDNMQAQIKKFISESDSKFSISTD